MLTIRPALPADCAALAQVQVNNYRTAYAGLFPPEYLAHFNLAEQEQDWLKLLAERPQDILLVAETAEKEIIGYALAIASRQVFPDYDAELVALHVRRGYQRGGAGKALVRRAVELLLERGVESVMLWTLKGNPIRKWYERLGGEFLGEKQDTIQGWTVVEVAYGWEDIGLLLAAVR